MSTYKELLAQRDDLEKAIAAARNKEVADAVATCKSLISDFELTADDLFGGGRGKGKAKSATSAKTPSPAKYRDKESGKEWTGRGRKPEWLKDKDLKQFEIAH